MSTPDEILYSGERVVMAPAAQEVRFERRADTVVCVVRMESGALATFSLDAAALARCAESMIAVMEVAR